MGFCYHLLSLTILCCVRASTEASICKANADCGNGECCYIKPEFEIVSRRRQAGILPLKPAHHDTGVCQMYKLEHAPCSPLEKANGHCGCGSGLTCQFVPAETAQPLVVSKKRKIFMPGPGAYQCEISS